MGILRRKSRRRAAARTICRSGLVGGAGTTVRSSPTFPLEDWRAALEICADKQSIAGVRISNVHIDSSLSNGVSVIARNGRTLSDALVRQVSVTDCGVGEDRKYGLFISTGARGRLYVRECSLGQVENEGKEFRLER